MEIVLTRPSSSRAIPGIPDASQLKISPIIQTLDALTAWLVFVLYAGPVASLFPDFQQNEIARSALDYARLRSERTALYRLRERLGPLRNLVRQQPELAEIGKAAISLRTHSEAEMRQALLDEPKTLQALASAPVVTDFMRKLGAPLPDLDGLVKEVAAISEKGLPNENEFTVQQNAPTLNRVFDAHAENLPEETETLLDPDPPGFS
jgi:hypothetical protein